MRCSALRDAAAAAGVATGAGAAASSSELSEEDSPAKKRHDRWTRENLGIEWTKALEEHFSGVNLNLGALDAQ